MRMVDRVHCNSAHFRPAPEPSLSSRLTKRDVALLDVANLPYSGIAIHQYLPDLAGRQSERRQIAFFCDQLRRAAGRPNHLSAFPRPQLDVMHRSSKRDVPERKRIARNYVRLRPRHNALSDFQTDRRENITLLTVDIIKQRDMSGSVRIVFDSRDLRGYAGLVSLKVDRAILALGSAPSPSHRDVTVIIAARYSRLRRQKRLVRALACNLVAGKKCLIPAPC